MLQASTLDFFKELKTNNNKEWFDQNRKRYDKVKADYNNLASSILKELKVKDESLDILQPKNCTFRINRDIRFSKDKSPYKTNLGLIFSPFAKRMAVASYYVHIEEGKCFVGGGLYMPDSTLLKKLRNEINFFHKDLTKILKDPLFVKTYGGLDINDRVMLKRPPKGYDTNHPAIEYLKLKSFTTGAKIPDDILTTEKLVPFLIENLSLLQPMISFINRGLMSNEEGGI